MSKYKHIAPEFKEDFREPSCRPHDPESNSFFFFNVEYFSTVKNCQNYIAKHCAFRLDYPHKELTYKSESIFKAFKGKNIYLMKKYPRNTYVIPYSPRDRRLFNIYNERLTRIDLDKCGDIEIVDGVVKNFNGGVDVLDSDIVLIFELLSHDFKRYKKEILIKLSELSLKQEV